MASSSTTIRVFCLCIAVFQAASAASTLRILEEHGIEVEPSPERELQTYTADGFQALMLDAVNAERAKAGLKALCTNAKLQAAAQGHSADMAAENYMSHTGSDGSTMSSRITASGYKWSSIAENVAAGQVDVAGVMSTWMGSSGHRANILSSAYTHFGTGYSYSSSSTYKHYWTQDFGSSSTDGCSSSGSSSSSSPVTTAPNSYVPATVEPPTTSTAPSTAPATQSSLSTMQAKMLVAINAERAKVGLAPLCTNTKLQTAAQEHSSDMATENYMSHTGSDGSTMSSRITASGYKWSNIAENVAAGQADVAAVVKTWMSSSGHRANILGSKFKHFGMGYAYSSSSTYKHYWTQDFGAGSAETCA